MGRFFLTTLQLIYPLKWSVVNQASLHSSLLEAHFFSYYEALIRLAFLLYLSLWLDRNLRHWVVPGQFSEQVILMLNNLRCSYLPVFSSVSIFRHMLRVDGSWTFHFCFDNIPTLFFLFFLLLVGMIWVKQVLITAVNLMGFHILRKYFQITVFVFLGMHLNQLWINL